jgi:teichuronic acid biosynthesis glycosyltransferase TuaH
VKSEGSWEKTVVVYAGSSWDATNPMPERHIAERLTTYASVLWVDPAVSMLSARRRPELAESLRGPRLRIVRPGLARYTPVVQPGPRRPGASLVTEFLVKRGIRRALAQLGAQSVARVLASDLPLYERDRRERRVLYATDDFSAGAELMGLSLGQIRRNERRLARQSDLVIGISPVIVDQWAERGCKTLLVANGCDTEMCASSDVAPDPTDVRLPRPIAGFIGHLSQRIDLSLLEAVADRGHSVLLVGPRAATYEISRIERLFARPNVQWVGPKPFEQLPSYLKVIDVGLTPYADSDFNRASMPLKTLEYLAAGKPSVVTDLPAARWLDTDLITLASGPAEFAAAVGAALAAPADAELTAARRAVAQRHSWEQRTADFAQALGLERVLAEQT